MSKTVKIPSSICIVEKMCNGPVLAERKTVINKADLGAWPSYGGASFVDYKEFVEIVAYCSNLSVDIQIQKEDLDKLIQELIEIRDMKDD